MIKECAFVDLKQIRTNGGTQSRGVMIDGVIDDYAELLDILPPVTVFYDGEAYWLADGFHRHAAFVKAGQHDILAEIRQGTRRDAILFSVGANAQHGLRRTRSDKQRAVMTLLNDAEWSIWSDREIAVRCVVSHTMVADLRRRRSASLAELPVRRTYKTKHGTTGTMKTAGINAGRQRKNKASQPITQHDEKPAAPVSQPVVHVEFQHDDTSSVWRSRLRDLMGEIDILLERAPTPADRAYALRRLNGKWQELAHNTETGEILDDVADAQQSSSMVSSSHNSSAAPQVRQASAEGLTKQVKTGDRVGSSWAEGQRRASPANLPVSAQPFIVDSFPDLPPALDRRVPR